MNQMVKGVDVEIGTGNPGAVGVFLHGAQGSSVQDVTVRMVDALAGFGGGGGAGASHLNVAAFGESLLTYQAPACSTDRSQSCRWSVWNPI